MPAVVLVGCSDDPGDEDEGSTSAATLAPEVCPSEQPVLRVDLIDDAVAALEAERGPGQRYFEINATDDLVNLFVVGDADGEVVPYVFLGGELSSEAPATGAEGNTFTADRLAFDPLKVTSCVADRLEAATLIAFEVLAGADGNVQYSVITRSTAGGRLISTVGPAGAIVGVQAVG